MFVTKLRQNLYAPALLFILELIILVPQSRFDPESHHDGVMFGAAIAVKDGLIPNRDVFAQYGPFTPLLQGYWLKLTGPHLINLRILSAILLSITGLLLYLILQKYFSTSLAFLSSLAWCITYPRYVLPPNLPWASIVSTLITLGAMYSLVDSWKSIYTSSPRGKNLFFAALLLTLGFSIRIQLAVTILLPTLLILLNLMKIEKKCKVLISWGSGIAIGSLTTLSYLLQNSALVSYLNQVLIWPARFYVKPVDLSDPGQIIELALLLLFPFFFIIFSFMLQKLGKKRKSIILFWFTTCFITAFASLAKIEHKSYLNPSYLVTALSQEFFQMLGYASVSFIIGIFLILTLKGYFRNFSPITLIAVASIIQLYPLHDALHLWWVTPIFLSAAAPILKEKLSNYRAAETPLKILMVGLLSSGLFLTAHYVNIERIDSKSLILSNMVGTRENILPMDEFISSVNAIPKSSKAIFECSDGLYAVADGSYLASDLNFYFAPIGLVNEYQDNDIIIRCRLSKSELLEIRSLGKFQILNQSIFEDGHVNVIMRFKNQE